MRACVKICEDLWCEALVCGRGLGGLRVGSERRVCLCMCECDVCVCICVRDVCPCVYVIHVCPCVHLMIMRYVRKMCIRVYDECNMVYMYTHTHKKKIKCYMYSSHAIHSDTPDG